MLKPCKLIISDEVNIKLEGLPIEVRRKLVNTFKFEKPGAKFHPAYRLGRWDGTTTLFGMGGNGFVNQLPTIFKILSDFGYEVTELEDKRDSVVMNFNEVTETYWADKGVVWPKGHVAEGQPIMLRDYQVSSINTLLKNPQALISAATGSGKTILTATLCDMCASIGRTIVIVPNKDLVEQTEEDFINCELDVGVYFGGRKELNKTHTICTWQCLNVLEKTGKKTTEDDVLTLAQFLDGVKTVIVDECHTASATVLLSLLTKHLNNACIRWGLTGTIPKEKVDQETIFASIGPVVGGVKAHDLQEKGVLANCHVNVLQFVDYKEFKSFTDEYEYLVTNRDRLIAMASYINEISKTGNTLVLVNRIETGNVLTELIAESSFVSGAVKSKDRKEEYKEIRTSTDKVLISTYGVAAVGLNIPRIFNLVLVEPGKSFVRVIQSIGRGLRKAEDKDFVNVWDFASTCKYSRKHLTERKKYYKDAQYQYSIKKIDWSQK